MLIMPEVQEGNRIVIASKGEKKDYSIGTIERASRRNSSSPEGSCQEMDKDAAERELSF